jgi:hypothetical protein
MELDPEPIPDPDFFLPELIAVTNELEISKPAIVQDPPLEEPPPIALPMSGGVPGAPVSHALASMQDSKIRMKPEIELPVETDPVPIPEPPYPV